MTTTAPLSGAASKAITRLRATLKGRVTTPGDAAYDAKRVVFSGAFDRRPAAIIRVADGDDVARVIEVARTSGLELAVRSGGHSAAGHGTTDGGLVIDLRDLDGGRDRPGAAHGAGWGPGMTAGEFTTIAAGTWPRRRVR